MKRKVKRYESGGYLESDDAKNLMAAAEREKKEYERSQISDEPGATESIRQFVERIKTPAKAPAPKAMKRPSESAIQPSTQDIDRLEADTTASRIRDERAAYMQERDAQAAAKRAKEMMAPTPKKQEGGLKKYAQILEEGKERRAAARAAEPKEEKTPMRRGQRGPKTEVPPRPSRAFSTPASRKAWDEEYGDKYEASGKRKPGMKAGGMVASKRADGIAQRGKTRGRII